MESPHCKIFSAGGIHLRILGVRYPCWLVRFSKFLHNIKSYLQVSRGKKKQLILNLLCRFGRHPVLIISVLFMLVFGLTVAFSVNVPMFSTLRFFEGFCLAGIILSLYVLSKSLSLNQKFCANWPLAKLFPSSLLLLRTPVKLSIVAQHMRRFTMIMLTCTQDCEYFLKQWTLNFTQKYTHAGFTFLASNHQFCPLKWKLLTVDL